MIQTFLRQLWLTIIVLAMQVMILNHVHICGYATPFICVYPLLVMPLSTPRWSKLLWGFAIGLVQDMFANTPGMMAATLTFIAMVQPRLLTLLGGVDGDDDDDEDTQPSISKLGAFAFIRYALGTVLLQCIVFYLLEIFSFFSIADTLINIFGSTALSLLIIWVIESIRSNTMRH